MVDQPPLWFGGVGIFREMDCYLFKKFTCTQIEWKYHALIIDQSYDSLAMI